MGRKLGVVPVLGEGELDPHITMSYGPRPTSVPSGILIHPTVWPRYLKDKDSSFLTPKILAKLKRRSLATEAANARGLS